jgi:hypothetical protein
MREQTAYYSYMLRLWQDDQANIAWRISLENAQTGERKGFANLDDLFSYLSQQIERSSMIDLDRVSREEDIYE